jgi:fructose-1-phosphate kinase PfkB-like protein
MVAVADAGASELLRAQPDLELATIEIEPSPVAARTDIVIVEADGRATVVNGSVAVVDAVALERTHDRVQQRVAELLGRGDLLVLAGSYPSSRGFDRYRALIEVAHARGARCVLDASGPWLRAALPARPDVLKLALDELTAATGGDHHAGWADAPAAVASIAEPPPTVIVTHGVQGARVWADGRAWSVAAPPVRAVNPAGAGDAATAGLVTALSSGADLQDAVVEAVAWGTAAVGGLDLVTDPGEVRRLRPLVAVKTLATA